MTRVIGPILIAVLVGLLMWHGARQYLTSRNPWEQKILEAKSILYYEIAEDRPISFAIFPTDRELRIVSHVQLPPTDYFDAEQRYRYGLQVSIREGERVTWEHDYWIETRQSKADLRDGVWLKESVFTLTGVELSDDRLVFISLPIGVPAREGNLTIRLLGWPERPALVRTYRTKPLTPLELTRTELALSSDDAFRLAQRVFKTGWRELTPFEREWLLKTSWERITPVGVSGVDYFGIPIYITTFQAPPVTPPIIAGEKLGPNQGIALNLRGAVPVALHARLVAEPASFEHQRSVLPAPQPPAEPVECRLDVSVLDKSETLQERALSGVLVSESFTRLGEVETSASGLSTLRVVNRCGNWISLAAIVPEEDRLRVVGDAVLISAPAVLGGGEIVQPDYRYFSVVRIGPDLPAEFPLFRDGAASTARVLAYRTFETFSNELTPFTLNLELRNERGEVILNQQARGEADSSPFEVFPHQDPAINEIVGTPQLVYVRFPAGANTLTLSSDTPVDVIVQTPYSLYEEAVLDPAYQEDIGNLIWRNEPLDINRFASVSPSEATVLRDAGRIRTLRAQPRLDLSPESRQGWTQAFRAIEPLGTPECAKLLEQARNPLERREDWTYTTFTELRVGQQARAEVPLTFHGRPVSLRYDAANTALLGETITVHSGDKTLASHVVRSLIGEVAIRLVPGVHEVSLSGPAEGIRYFINVPVAASPLGDRYTQRTVCRLGSGGLRYPVFAPGTERVSVNVLVYQLGGAAPALVSGVFDGGNPTLRAPVLATGITPAQRAEQLVFDLSSRSILDTRREARVTAPQVFVMTLFEDAARGSHNLALYNQGRADLWVRVFVAGELDIPGEGYMVWTTTR